MHTLRFILLFAVSTSYSDPLLDSIMGNYDRWATPTEEQSESYDGGGEHYSWELGTNESIPETEVIIDPYMEEDLSYSSY